jgi:hypothetical protein
MKLENSSQIDWATARTSAAKIVSLCEESAFVAPEALDLHHEKIVRVCHQLDAITKALCITPRQPKPEASA